ncbi:MAG: ribonuclease E inhibitor RraB [Bacteroidota bacterium]
MSHSTSGQYGAHRRALQLTQLLSGNAKDKHLLTIWFFGDRERDIYRLAAELQRRNIPIQDIRKTYDGSWLCIGMIEQPVVDGMMNQLYHEMCQLARQFKVKFDGWEARIEL